MIKFCLGITFYNPTLLDLQKVIDYCKLFHQVYVVDNSDISVGNKSYFDNIDNIEFLHYGSNIGLSKALNLICLTAVSNFDYVCLMDQDSVFKNSEIEKLINEIIIDNDKFTAIYSPYIHYLHKNTEMVQPSGFKNVDWVITSGSFLNLSLFKDIGGFDEHYFIDRLDYDYCYFSKLKGYNIKVSNSAVLQQSLGSQSKFLCFNFYQHSPLRNYYSFRNRIYFYLQRKNNPNKLFSFLLLFLLSLKQISSIIFIENEKLKKIKFILLAVRDYFGRNMGKFHQ